MLSVLSNLNALPPLLLLPETRNTKKPCAGMSIHAAQPASVMRVWQLVKLLRLNEKRVLKYASKYPKTLVALLKVHS